MPTSYWRLVKVIYNVLCARGKRLSLLPESIKTWTLELHSGGWGRLMFNLNSTKAVCQENTNMCSYTNREEEKTSQRPLAPRKCLLEAENGASRPVKARNKTSNKIQLGYPSVCSETQVNWLEGGE